MRFFFWRNTALCGVAPMHPSGSWSRSRSSVLPSRRCSQLRLLRTPSHERRCGFETGPGVQGRRGGRPLRSCSRRSSLRFAESQALASSSKNSCALSTFRNWRGRPRSRAITPSVHAILKIHRPSNGEMAEWLKAHAWKACIGETLSRVRIPLSPPRIEMEQHLSLNLGS
jgi:hypothetical protein